MAKITGNSGNNKLYGTDGEDYVYGQEGDDTLFGGSGNDYLYGKTGNDVLVGGFGDDVLVGGAGNDMLKGNAGNDLFLQDDNGGVGNDAIDGGIDFDTVQYGSMVGHLDVFSVNVDLNQGKAYKGQAQGVDTLKNIENVIGTDLADQIIGNAINNTFEGGVGDDILDGAAGNDRLYGGSGNDQLKGADGDDILYGGGGADIIDGGAGNDWIQQDIEAVDDRLDGGAGFDQLDYGVTDLSALGTLFGVSVDLGQGLTQKLATGGVDHLFNIEIVFGTGLTDWLNGNADSNTLRGAGGDDILDGAAGNDVLYGDSGADLVQGGAGNDLIIQNMVDAGYDKLDGGDGVDTVDYNYSGPNVSVAVDVNLSTHKARKLAVGAAEDTLVNIENVDGTEQADVLTGDDGSNMLEGNAGNDRLDGAAGNDTLFGGAGVDRINGGDGDDRIKQDFEAVNDRLDGGAGSDTVDYGVFDLSALNATVGVNVDLTTGQARKLAVGGGVDTLLNIENVTGTALADVLNGDAGDNVLMGGAGNDVLRGNRGNDTLYGGAGADNLNGGAGDDVIKQDMMAVGSDQIDGESGVNTLDYSVTNLSGQGMVVGVTVDLVKGKAQKLNGAVDTLKNIENVIGTNGLADQLTGDALDNVLDGGSGDDVLSGAAGSDTLYGKDGADILIGGSGSDTLVGGNGADLYQMSRGDGQDTIIETAYAASDATTMNTVQWAANVASTQLWFTRLGQDLQVSIVGTADRVTVSGWYAGASRQGERFIAGDGKTLYNTDVNALVHAMSGFALPVAGQTTLSADVLTSLAPVLANWHATAAA